MHKANVWGNPEILKERSSTILSTTCVSFLQCASALLTCITVVFDYGFVHFFLLLLTKAGIFHFSYLF